MSWTNDVVIRIELPNGEVWEIGYAWAARLLAEVKYPEKGDDHFDERKFYLDNPDEAALDLPNMVDWNEVESVADRIDSGDEAIYHSLWMKSDLDVIHTEDGE